MADLAVYQVLAKAFAAEGVDKLFTLMGNGNMYWSYAMAKDQGIKTIHARHEHCAVAMAEGYFRATGKVGVASVTCGPGLTQIMTALTIAARANIPLVVFAGESPMHAAFHDQRIDQAPFSVATGAHFVPVRSMDRMLNDVREAFHVAQTQRRPVVLSVPEDFQNQTFPYPTDYTPSADFIPTPQRSMPDPEIVDQIVDMIGAAQHPIILAGRGAMWSGAVASLEEIAKQCGALLATSLYAKGLFEGNPFDLGIAGAFATNLARELFAESDLVIGVGASLGYFTTEGGYLYPNARVVQLDTSPRGLWQGLRVADLYLKSDAKTGADLILAKLRERNFPMHGWRTPELARRIAAEIPDGKELEISAGTVDPRAIVNEFDRIIPKDWQIVSGGAHFFNFAMTHLKGRAAERYHVINGFGAIGSALPAAIGMAATRNDGKVLLIEGDGSLLMHIQELETIKRHGLQLLICVMNDGGYGAEFHPFRAKGMDETQAMHGRGDLAMVARGFGLRGEKVTSLGRLESLFQDHIKANSAELWDLHVADIASAPYRRLYYGET
jgi:thiamine pyrophosphate-dependent acetolactate synthase large subunit-like protein